MAYNFDKVIERRISNSMKWNALFSLNMQKVYKSK